MVWSSVNIVEKDVKLRADRKFSNSFDLSLRLLPVIIFIVLLLLRLGRFLFVALLLFLQQEFTPLANLSLVDESSHVFVVAGYVEHLIFFQLVHNNRLFDVF